MNNSSKRTTEQIEREIQDVIVKYSLQNKLTLNKVKEWVYETSDSDPEKALKMYLSKLKQYFNKVKNKKDFEYLTKIFVDAWNHFPHKDLGDLSPTQKLELQTKGSFVDDTAGIEYTEIVIPFEMTAILTIKAKMVGMSLREYILFVMAKHIEETLSSSFASLNNLLGDSEKKVNSLPQPQNIKPFNGKLTSKRTSGERKTSTKNNRKKD